MLYKEVIVINLYLPINTAADYIKKMYEKYENLSKNTIKLGNLGLHLQIRLNQVNKNKKKVEFQEYEGEYKIRKFIHTFYDTKLLVEKIK